MSFDKVSCPSCGGPTANPGYLCANCDAKQRDIFTNTTSNSGTSQGAKQDQTRWITTLLLCWFLGSLGIHRFYTGHTAIGVVQLLTLGGCGIWVLIDFIILVTGNFKDADGNPIKG